MPRAKQDPKLAQIRRNNLQLLVDSAGGQNALARVTGTPAAYYSQLLSGDGDRQRALGPQVALRIERALRLPPGWFETKQDSIPVATLSLIRSAVSDHTIPAVRALTEAKSVSGLADAAGPYIKAAAERARLEWDMARELPRAMLAATGWVVDQLELAGWITQTLPNGVVEASRGDQIITVGAVIGVEEITISGSRWTLTAPEDVDFLMAALPVSGGLRTVWIPRAVVAASSRDGKTLSAAQRSGTIYIGSRPLADLPASAEDLSFVQ